MTLALRGAAVRGHEREVDVVIDGETIAAVGRDAGEQADDSIDVSGHLVLAGLVDPHVHLDKCLLRAVMRPNESGSLQEAIEITNDFKREYDPDEVAERATRVIHDAVANGTTSMRVFTDVGTIGGLRPFEGLRRARDAVRGLADVQLVAFPQEGIVRDPGAQDLLAEALDAGADVVGGLPWYEFTDADMRRHIDVCFELANRFDRPIHMLVDDTDDPNSRSLEYLAYKTMQEGLQGHVSASHCGALAAYDDTYAAKVVDMVRRAEINIVSNAHISLMLAGRRDHQPVRRGITRVRELLAAGVNVASGQDDVHDPYYPFGQPDQLEVAVFMAHTAHMSLPDELETVLDMVTVNAARVLGLERYGVAVGRPADLVVVPGRSTLDVLRRRPPRRYVFKRGRLVAEARVEQTVAAR